MARSIRRSLREEFWNLPNMLTVGRVIIIPVVLYFLARATPVDSLIAALLFIAASVTDAIDGYLARRWNLITTTGKFLDPLADKLIVMAVLVQLVAMGRIPAWLVIVLLAREFTITALRSIASSEGLVIAAGQDGKIKAALQMTGISLLSIHYAYPAEFVWYHPVVDFHLTGYWLLLLSMIFSVTSALGYLRDFYRAAAEAKERTQG